MGFFVPSGPPDLSGNTISARPLRSTGVTRRRRYYGPLRLLRPPHGGYAFPSPVADDSRHRLPSQVSQVPDCSLDARCPHSPRRARPLHVLVASRSMTGFTIVGRLATLTFVTRPNRVHACALRLTSLSLTGFARPGHPAARRSTSWRTSNYHGQYLSTDKNNQASLAHQRHKEHKVRKESLISTSVLCVVVVHPSGLNKRKSWKGVGRLSERPQNLGRSSSFSVSRFLAGSPFFHGVVGCRLFGLLFLDSPHRINDRTAGAEFVTIAVGIGDESVGKQSTSA